jgi:hypothetical protein
MSVNCQHNCIFDSFAEPTALFLLGKYFLKDRENLRPCFLVERSQLSNKTGLVHGTYLIENNLTYCALKSAFNPRRIGSSLRCHRGNDYGSDITVHLIWRNH